MNFPADSESAEGHSWEGTESQSNGCLPHPSCNMFSHNGTNGCQPTMRRSKRSLNDLKLHDTDGDSHSDSTLPESDPVMRLDELNSSFLFAGNEPSTCLKREFTNLPMPLRERVSQDMYGFGESQDVSSEKFALLEHEIRKIPDKVAYDLAYRRAPYYVRNQNFLLKFIRACNGDSKKAAKRITRHFTTKLNLFGEDKLVKDIEVSDLDEDDMEALASGGFQVLPQRDLAGRSVLFGRYTAMRYKTPKNMLRALWYIWMTILEDEINQVKGVVAVGYELFRVPLERFDITDDNDFEMLDAEGGFDRDLAREIIRIPLSVPARPVGYHLCTDSHQWVGILEMVMVTLCKFVRLRMKIHHGSEQECKYGLITHGIPVECIPVSATGTMEIADHVRWIEQRQQLEESRQRNTDC